VWKRRFIPQVVWRTRQSGYAKGVDCFLQLERRKKHTAVINTLVCFRHPGTHYLASMDQKLAEYASLAQRDKAPAYLSLLSEVLSRPDQTTISADLHTLVDTVVNQESVGLVVARQVLAELVKQLGEGKLKDVELRKGIVEDTLSIVATRQNSYDELVSASHLCTIHNNVLNARTVGQRSQIPTCRLGRGRGRLVRGCQDPHEHTHGWCWQVR
jgi:hypothetical protein